MNFVRIPTIARLVAKCCRQRSTLSPFLIEVHSAVRNKRPHAVVVLFKLGNVVRGSRKPGQSLRLIQQLRVAFNKDSQYLLAVPGSDKPYKQAANHCAYVGLSW